MDRKYLIPAIALIAVSAVALSTLGSPSTAQQPSVGAQRAPAYAVQKGDTMWGLAGEKLGDPLLWEELVACNPDLQQPGRRFIRKDGVTMLMIRPGERLNCLEELGFKIPLKAPAEVPTSIADNTPPFSESPKTDGWLGSNALWWILAAFALLCALLALWMRNLRRDPVTSGPAMVPGGVHTPADAAARFTERGLRERQDFTILSTIPGLISGAMIVSYAYGLKKRRLLNNEPGFRATVRHADGTVEELYMLQRCGNDLRFGRIHRYIPGSNFRFEPTGEPLVAPPPAAEVVAEPAPATEATPEPAVNASTADKADIVCVVPGQVVCEWRAATDNQPEMARMTGIGAGDVTVTRDGAGVTFRFNPPNQLQAA